MNLYLLNENITGDFIEPLVIVLYIITIILIFIIIIVVSYISYKLFFKMYMDVKDLLNSAPEKEDKPDAKEQDKLDTKEQDKPDAKGQDKPDAKQEPKPVKPFFGPVRPPHLGGPRIYPPGYEGSPKDPGETR